MPAPLTAILAPMATELALKAAKAIWAKMPWAKDPVRVGHVERLIDALVADSARLARSLPEKAISSELDRLMARFSVDLQQEGIPVDQARQLTDTLRKQIQVTVIEPIDDNRRIHARLETLEAENQSLAQQIADLSRRAETYEKAGKNFAVIAGAMVIVLFVAIIALRR
jgi:DNA-binding transcriptional MerR regulator